MVAKQVAGLRRAHPGGARHWRAAVAVLVIGVLAVAVLAAAQAGRGKVEAVAFRDAMRKLWEDHITWTRLVIVSVLNGLPDTETTVARLLQNQADIGNAIKPFYGEAAGNELAALLHDHITIAAEILVAAKTGDGAALNDALDLWYANADTIAIFLSNANPENWPEDVMKAMMKEHLDLTLQEAVAYLQGDHAGSVGKYDEVHQQILGMADMVSIGIIRQFPEMFVGVGGLTGGK